MRARGRNRSVRRPQAHDVPETTGTCNRHAAEGPSWRVDNAVSITRTTANLKEVARLVIKHSVGQLREPGRLIYGCALAGAWQTPGNPAPATATYNHDHHDSCNRLGQSLDYITSLANEGRGCTGCRRCSKGQGRGQGCRGHGFSFGPV